MVRPMRTAVVGCGEISEIYLQNMTSCFSVLEVCACCSQHGESARQKAERYGLRACTFEEILADTSIELIVNLTPAPAHYDIVRRSLLAGKHVYTEKILTPELSSARELLELAREKGLVLGAAPDTFLGAAVQTAKAAADQGMIGRITSCHASVNRDLSALYTPGAFGTLPGGGIGFDLGVYYLTVLLCILGPVAQAAGMLRTNGPQRVMKDPASPRYGEEFPIQNENLMTGVLAFENGVLGTLHFTGCSILPEAPHIQLYGSQGILYIPNPNMFGGQVLVQKKGMEAPLPLPHSFGFAGNCRGLGVAEMAWAIRGSRPNRASGALAYHALEVFTAIAKSSQNGRFEQVASRFEIPRPLPEGYMDGYYRQNPESALID